MLAPRRSSASSAHRVDRGRRRRARPSRRQRTRPRDRARSSVRIRNSSSAGTCGPRARAAAPPSRPTNARAPSRATTRPGKACLRAPHSAASVEVDAVSSMWPCQLARQAEQLGQPVQRHHLELGRRRRSAPEDLRHVQRRCEQLREDARLRARRREIGEETADAASALSPAAAPRRGRASTAENGSPASGGDSGSARRISPGSTCASTGSSRTRSRYEAAHSSAAAPSSRKLNLSSFLICGHGPRVQRPAPSSARPAGPGRRRALDTQAPASSARRSRSRAGRPPRPRPARARRAGRAGRAAS